MNDRRKIGKNGGARIKFLIVMAILLFVAYCAYIYIPVAYQAFQLKDLMQHDVDVAVAQGYPPAWVGDQLRKTAGEYGMPSDAVITPAQKDNRVQVRVQFTKL